MVDKRNNYEDDEKVDYKNLNAYDEIFKKAHDYVTKRNRIDAIYEKLIKDINTDNIKTTIQQIEQMLQ